MIGSLAQIELITLTTITRCAMHASDVRTYGGYFYSTLQITYKLTSGYSRPSLNSPSFPPSSSCQTSPPLRRMLQQRQSGSWDFEREPIRQVIYCPFAFATRPPKWIDRRRERGV